MEPFDEPRLDAIKRLADSLSACEFLDRAYDYEKSTWRHQTFFEAYFSNFIEGVEFEISEVERIVFEGRCIDSRHADSHDVIAVFELAHNLEAMLKTPEDAEDFISLLKARHEFIMNARPDKRPGLFKTKANKAGNTVFVSPENIIGTLAQGFDIYRQLKGGLEKALFIHYLVATTHPFDDGNGRLSRIMMNAELVSSGKSKIIVPTVYRENYINGLRRAEQHNNFGLYVSSMDLAQAYTHSVDWLDYGASITKIEQDKADSNPDDGLTVFYRAVQGLKRSVIPVKPSTLKLKS